MPDFTDSSHDVHPVHFRFFQLLDGCDADVGVVNGFHGELW
jgi:hypothetical protein